MSGNMQRAYFNNNTIDIDMSGPGFQGISLNLAGEESKVLEPGKKHTGISGNTNVVSTHHEVAIRPKRNFEMSGDHEVVEFKEGATLMNAYGFVMSGGSKMKSDDLIFIGDIKGEQSAQFVANPDDPQVK